MAAARVLNSDMVIGLQLDSDMAAARVFNSDMVIGFGLYFFVNLIEYCFVDAVAVNIW